MASTGDHANQYPQNSEPDQDRDDPDRHGDGPVEDRDVPHGEDEQGRPEAIQNASYQRMARTRSASGTATCRAIDSCSTAGSCPSKPNSLGLLRSFDGGPIVERGSTGRQALRVPQPPGWTWRPASGASDHRDAARDEQVAPGAEEKTRYAAVRFRHLARARSRPSAREQPHRLVSRPRGCCA